MAEFISHPDFYDVEPINIYHKELVKVEINHPPHLQNKHIIYRRHANFGAFERAVLKISADDYYKLYINGRFVTQGPAHSYPHAYFYNEIDVSDYLCEGENVFAVHTYYQGLMNNVWVTSDLKQMLWCELSLDGEVVLESDESWICKYHTAYSEYSRIGYDTNFGECYDAASPDVRFYDSDFDEAGFVKARINKRGGWNLRRQNTPQLDIYEVEPAELEYTDYGIRLVLPSEMAGYLSFTAKGNRGDSVIIRCGEELNDDGSVRFMMRATDCNYEEKMILSGGEDKLMHYDYIAFRYAELHFPKSVNISDVKMRVQHYPFEKKHSYNVDDEKLRAVIELCENTIKYGTLEDYLDCPTREKGAYLGDLMVSGRAHAILTHDLTLLKQAAINFTTTTIICPGLTSTYATTRMQEIADYSLEYPALLTWIYSQDKDIEFLRATEPCATGVYEYFTKYENADGLLESVKEKWNLVDWPQNLRDNYDFELTHPIGDGMHNVINALWYGFKLAMDELYRILGKSYDFGLEKTKSSFISTFYSDKLGLFVDTPVSNHASVHSNVFPLLFGMVDSDAALVDRIAEHIKNKRLTSMGVYMTYFTMAGLMRVGKEELCRELTCDEGAWLNMIKEGATTTFEAWGKDQKWNTSLCHPWATSPLIIFSGLDRLY